MRLSSTLEHGVCQLIRTSMDLISHQHDEEATWEKGEKEEATGVQRNNCSVWCK